MNRLHSVHRTAQQSLHKHWKGQQQRHKEEYQDSDAVMTVPGDALVVAIEGGVLLRDDNLHCFAWAAVKQQAAGEACNMSTHGLQKLQTPWHSLAPCACAGYC
jgi:hypothetical protein